MDKPSNLPPGVSPSDDNSAPRRSSTLSLLKSKILQHPSSRRAAHDICPWRPTEGTFCQECLTIPPSIFTPGSSSAHFIYQGDNALERIRDSIEKNCRLCTLIYDALEAGQGSEPVTIDRNGIQLKPEWTPLQPEMSRTMRFDSSAPTHNRHLLDVYAGPSSRPQDRFGPFLRLSWGDSVSQLRFNVKQDPPGRAAGIYTTSWDAYTGTENFQPAERSYGNTTVEPMSRLAARADSPETFRLMNSWLDKCMAEHTYTCTYVGDRVVSTGFSSPTRLIKVGRDGERPRLVSAATLPRDQDDLGPSYFALSHCWGNPDFVPKTTAATLERHMSVGFDYAQLPPTFRDAIRITRELNVGYLWIDALCIVQDEPVDKNREIPAMDLIYSTAICVLVAAGSPDDLGGCFLPRDANPDVHVRPFTMTLDQPQRLSVTIQPYVGDWSQALTSGPLFKRGWCFQERQLAKRLIHFTKAQILWECRRALACEAYPAMKSHRFMANPSAARPFRMTWMRASDETVLPGNPRRVEPWLKEWRRIVESYSGKKLSLAADRLPAVAGVAAYFEQKLRGPHPLHSFYLAGLWHRDLAMGLAWCPDFTSLSSSPDAPGRRSTSWPPPFRDPATLESIEPGRDALISRWLPTWSWISVDGPVRYFYSEGFTEIQSPSGVMIDVRARDGGLPGAYFPLEVVGGGVKLPPEGFRFGEVLSGYLELDSYLVEVTISEKNLIADSGAKAGTSPKCYSMFKGALDPLRLGNRRLSSARGIIFFDVDPPELPETRVCCLRLGTARSRFDKSEGLVEFGLALIKVTDAIDLDIHPNRARWPLPELRRVGLFEIDVWNKQWPKEARRKTVRVL
ncbi:hypothetical protein VTK56DRAFT_4937 [Thermocarpiscus australiensis]